MLLKELKEQKLPLFKIDNFYFKSRIEETDPQFIVSFSIFDEGMLKVGCFYAIIMVIDDIVDVDLYDNFENCEGTLNKLRKNVDNHTLIKKIKEIHSTHQPT